MDSFKYGVGEWIMIQLAVLYKKEYEPPEPVTEGRVIIWFFLL